jgi:protease-4
MSKFGGAGFVHAVEIGDAMDAVRKAKKPVLVYGTMLGDRGLLIASHASEIWIDPLGGAYIEGLGGQSLYFAKLLERLKISAHVFRVGTYKDFVEPYIRDRCPNPRVRRARLCSTRFCPMARECVEGAAQSADRQGRD